jgi:signal-transduction protein with cAMP-binding, CBS, and nucleotidyltransferase domain
MAQAIRDIMASDIVTLPSSATVTEAAQRMRDSDIGNVVIQDGPGTLGILTDRDITVRSTAEGAPPDDVTVGEICTTDLTTIAPDAPIERAVQMMRERAVRRLPVAEDGRIIGIVSLGDLALERDQSSALADISAAEPQE